MTSFYSWRLMFLTFYGTPRGDKHTHEHAHESPMVMLIPLGVLSLGAVFAGAIWYNSFFGHTDSVAKFFGVPYAEAGEHSAEGDGHGEEASHGEAADAGHGEGDKSGEHHYVFAGQPGEGAIYVGADNDILTAAHEVPKWVKVSPFIAMLLGLGTAYWFYIVNPKLPKRLAESQRPLYLFLLNKWYFDEIYDFLFVKSAKALGRLLWKRGDGNVIDGSLNGVAMGFIPMLTRLAGKAQSGYIFTYAFYMVIGIAALVTWMTLSGGAH